MTKVPKIGSFVINFGPNGDEGKLVKVVAYGRNNSVIVEKEKSNNYLIRAKRWFTGSHRSVNLTGLHILEDVQIFPKDEAHETHIRGRREVVRQDIYGQELKLVPKSLRALNEFDIVVWESSKCFQSLSSQFSEEIFVGAIRQTFESHNIINHETNYFAEVAFFTGTEKLLGVLDRKRYEMRAEVNGLMAALIIPIHELKIVGETLNDAGVLSEQNTGKQEVSEQPGPSPKTRFPAEEASKNQEKNWLAKQSPIELNSKSYPPKYGDTTISLKGIQGKNNSCYMDSSLFVLFGAVDIFDNVVFNLTQDDPTIYNLQQWLLLIVNQLRSEFYVTADLVNDFRQAMMQANQNYGKSAFMDAEEFILDLLNTLSCPDFFHFSNEASDKIHQIIVPATDRYGQEKYLLSKTVKTLLEDSLWYNEVNFSKRPDPALILKLPFCDGKPHFGCRLIIPDLKLELKLTTKATVSLDLFGIICLKSCHYTCYVKSSQENSSPWLYFDSDPVNMEPKVLVLQTLGQDLMQVADTPGALISSNSLLNADHIRFICTHCYMLFYK